MVHAGAPDPTKVRSSIVGKINTSAQVKKVRTTSIRTHTKDIALPAPDKAKHPSHAGHHSASASVHCHDFEGKKECLRSLQPKCQWGHHKGTGSAAVFEAMPKGRCERAGAGGGCSVM
eukprot:Hpha_TRINITY_DN15979_c4_g6::TRINITY_DN15979_c4_g6_i1::g.73371::m.73371